MPSFLSGRYSTVKVRKKLYVAKSEWGSRRYLDAALQEEWPHREAGL